jgi:hypothetical protein
MNHFFRGTISKKSLEQQIVKIIKPTAGDEKTGKVLPLLHLKFLPPDNS